MTTVHNMHCQEPWFSLLREGTKPVEGRKGTPRWREIAAGDRIEFTNGQEAFTALVEDVREYADLDSYLISEGLRQALPGVKTLEEGRAIYLQWSTEEEIQKQGFLAIQIRRL